MASLSNLDHFAALSFILIFLGPIAADPIPSFSFNKFDKDAYFESNIALFGDAEVVNGGSSVQLTHSLSSSAGRVTYKKPIKIVEGNPEFLVSFSTYFSFSLSKDNGDGLAFALVPSGFDVTDAFRNNPFGLRPVKNRTLDRTVAVKFDSIKNRLAIDVGDLVNVKLKNMSSLNLVLNGGSTLQSWIDYEAGSRRLEVRLSELGDSRPLDPAVSQFIDLWKLWKEEDVFLGLASSNGKSNQTCFVHSWSFKLRSAPRWMHSQPLDPQAIGANTKALEVREKNDCFLKVLAAMIFGTGSGALGAFIVLYLWTIFGSRRPVAPEDFVVEPVDLKSKRVEVVVDKGIKDVKATK